MNHKIFLSLASWRDPFVINSIKSAIEKAKYPELLTFGVVFDGYEEDDWMLEGIEQFDNVRLIKQDARSSSIYLCEVRGDIAMSLYDGEDYFFQSDCHVKFQKDWDVALRAELALAKKVYGEKTILTSINSGFGQWAEDFIEAPFVCLPTQEILDEFNPNPPVRGELVLRKMGSRIMIMERFFNAGMFFATSDFVKTVTQPKQFSFMLEQPIMTLRTFSAGYNMITTTTNYVSNFDFNGQHWPVDDHVRHQRSTDPLWEEAWREAHDKSLNLYKDVLNNNIVNEEYGMFPERTVDDYVEFAGFDPRTMKMVREASLFEHPYLELTDEEWETLMLGMNNVLQNIR